MDEHIMVDQWGTHTTRVLNMCSLCSTCKGKMDCQIKENNAAPSQLGLVFILGSEQAEHRWHWMPTAGLSCVWHVPVIFNYWDNGWSPCSSRLWKFQALGHFPSLLTSIGSKSNFPTIPLNPYGIPLLSPLLRAARLSHKGLIFCCLSWEICGNRKSTRQTKEERKQSGIVQPCSKMPCLPTAEILLKFTGTN